jgi:protein O-mannosyl-transferase
MYYEFCGGFICFKKKSLLPLQALFILIFAFALYYPSLKVPFLYDDADILLRPRTFERAENLRDLFSKNYFARFGERTYRPVMTVTFFADHHFFGVNPKGYHAVNIAIHALASLCVLLLLRELGISAACAFIGGLIFAAHPIQTEAVILASNREELLCGLFYFLSLWLYVRGGRAAFAGSVAAFFFAIFSKEMAASLPLVLFAYDYYKAAPGENSLRVIRRRLFSYAPYFAVIAAFLVLRYTIFRNTEGEAGWPGGSPYSTLLTMSYVFFKYLKLLFIPFSQCADYVVPALRSLFNFKAFLSLSGLAAFFAAAIYLRGRARFAGFAMAFFVLALLPVSNLIPFGATMADRYLYIPAFALSLAAAALAERFSNSAFRIVAALLIVAALSFLTLRRADAWQSDVSLWSNTTVCAPESAKAFVNLGNAYMRNYQPQKAIGYYEKVTSKKGEYEQGKYFYNLGLAYESLGRTDQARQAFESSAAASPRFPEPLFHLALIAARNGDMDAGLNYSETAVLEDPERADSNYSAGRFIMRYFNDTEHLQLAALHLKKAVALELDSSIYYGSLGEAYIRLNMYNDAEKALLQSIKNDRFTIPSYRLLISLYRTTGFPEKAEKVESELRAVTYQK